MLCNPKPVLIARMNSQYLHKKRLFGLVYGLAGGLAFSIAAWGVGGLQLALAHAAFPWLTFIPGGIIALAAGGLAGWWTARAGSHALGLVLWLLLAAFLVECTLRLPLEIAPWLIARLDATLGAQIHLTALENAGQVRLISFVVIGLAAGICGLLELNLAEQYLLSSAQMGFVGPLLLIVVLMGLAGGAVDYMLTSSLREPVQAMDALIEFAAQHIDEEVDAETARAMHLSTVKPLGDLVSQPHQILVVGNDANLGQIHTLVDFGGRMARCTVMYGTPVHCEILP